VDTITHHVKQMGTNTQSIKALTQTGSGHNTQSIFYYRLVSSCISFYNYLYKFQEVDLG